MHTPRYPVARCLIGLFGLFVCVASVAADESDSRQFECRFAIGPITVDGDLSEDAWKHAQAIDRFYLPWLPDRPAAKAMTRAKLLWDREYLYFAAELDDVDLFADIVEHDGKLWQNDVFELFFKPADDKPGYYEFHVTAAGTVLDAFFQERGKYEGAFKRGVRDDDFHIEAKVRCDGTLNQRQDRDRGWTVEARMPWFDFLRTGGRPDVDEMWKFALCRYDYTIDTKKPELSTSAPLSLPNFHRHEDYATLRFVGSQIVGRIGNPSDNVGRIGNPSYTLAQLQANWRSVPSRVVGSPEPPPPYRVRRVLPALKPSFPVTMINEPGSRRLLFIEQDKPYGPTRLCRTSDDLASGEFETLLDLGGLCFSIAFHPRFHENGFVYIGGTGRAADDKEEKVVRVTRYRINREPPFRLDPDSKQLIIEWDSAGHSGAAMAFGPDGLFYVTSGDGTSDSDGDLAGQRLDILRSKVLRIDVDRPDPGEPGGVSPRRDYSVPADNPFVGVKDARPETWAYGFRNPWRMWIDHETGQLWVANNGQDLWESVYLVERGANYGWSVFEGGHLFNANRLLGPTPVSKPMFDHSHAEARSMTGGVVYRGSRLPELRGASIYADYATGKIWGAKVEGRQVVWHKELADSPLSITAIAVDADGELLIADHQGNEAAGFYTLQPNDHADVSGDFPRKLSETGLFASVPEHRLAAGMIPYSVNSPLWSDGASKERALYLPPTAEIVAPISNQSRPPRGVPGTEEPARIDVLDGKGWNCPDRTVLVKSFALELEPGNPRSRRWIETRLFTRQEGEWVGYSYSWNDAQTEATLVARDGLDRTFELESPTGVTRQTWRYPSRAECMVCHSRAANYVLGLSTTQMNKEHDYDGVRANQLEVLESLGVLRVDAATASKAAKSAQHDALVAAGLSKAAADELAKTLAELPDQRQSRASRLLPRRPEEYPRLADPYDSRQNLASRARSYLQANCAHCHVNAGGGNAQINLLSSVPLAKMKLIDEKPMHDTFGLEDARLIAPGHPERSVLLHRVAMRGGGQMPQVATTVVDRQAVEMLREWIRRLDSGPSRIEKGANHTREPQITKSRDVGRALLPVAENKDGQECPSHSDGKPRRLLIVGQGPDGHPPATHEFMAGANVLAELLKPYNDIQLTVANADEPWADGPKLIDQADGVVMLVTQGAQWMQLEPGRHAALKRLAARGGAIVALHWSVGAKDAKYIQGQLDLLGATRGGPQRKYRVLATELKRVAPEHPILSGIGDFKVYDEIYYALDRVPDIQPLLTARIDGQDEMAAWAWERTDGGRAFGFVGLHFHSNWQLPEYRRFVVQGVRWSLKLPIPAGGVNVDIDSKQLGLDGVLPAPAGRRAF